MKTEAATLSTFAVDLMSSVWAEVFGGEVSPDADFFDLGGTSLHAMKIVTRVKEQSGIDLPVRAVFENSTVKASVETIATQCTLLHLFRGALGHQGCGVDDDFFRLGGTPFSAREIVAKIDELYSVSLTANTLLSYPTARSLAEFVENESSNAGAASGQDRRGLGSSLIRLQSGTNPPLILLPPASGQAICYRTLIDTHLVCSSIYAARASDLDWQGDLLSMSEMVGQYTVDLRRLQPQGPYTIAGWSFGGLLAFDIALHLRANRQQVAQLIIFDTGPPLTPLGVQFTKVFVLYLELLRRLSRAGSVGRWILAKNGCATPHQRALLNLQWDRSLSARELRNVVRAAFPKLAKTLKLDDYSVEELCELLVKTIRPHLPDARWLEIAKLMPSGHAMEFVQYQKVTAKNGWFSRVYRPREMYDGPITVYASEQNELAEQWQRYCTQPVDVRRFPIQAVDGNTPHLSFFAEENVKLFAADLRELLERPVIQAAAHDQRKVRTV